MTNTIVEGKPTKALFLGRLMADMRKHPSMISGNAQFFLLRNIRREVYLSLSGPDRVLAEADLQDALIEVVSTTREKLPHTIIDKAYRHSLEEFLQSWQSEVLATLA